MLYYKWWILLLTKNSFESFKSTFSSSFANWVVTILDLLSCLCNYWVICRTKNTCNAKLAFWKVIIWRYRKLQIYLTIMKDPVLKLLLPWVYDLHILTRVLAFLSRFLVSLIRRCSLTHLKVLPLNKLLLLSGIWLRHCHAFDFFCQ